jgi:hypothetical protein
MFGGRRRRSVPGVRALFVLVVLLVAVHAAPASAAIGFDRTDIPLVDGAAAVGPESLAIADLDGKLGPDIVVALPGPDKVGVMLNQGDGTFAPMVTYPACADPVDVTLGDVTATGGGLQPDGITDVLVACSPSIGRLAGDGNGGFGAPTTRNFGVAPYTTNGSTLDLIALANLRGDPSLPRNLMYEGSGASGRVLCADYDFGATAPSCTIRQNNTYAPVQGPLVVGNINGGTRDEIMSGTTGHQFAVFGLAEVPQLVWSDSEREGGGATASVAVESMTVADIEPDGDLDVVIGHFFNSLSTRVPSLDIQRWGDTGIPAGQQPTTVNSVPGLDDVEVADVDGDGKNDIFAVGSYGTLTVNLGDGAGGFDNGQDFPLYGFGNPAFTTRLVAAVADFDCDGRPDLAISDGLSNQVSVERNTTTSATRGSCVAAPPPPPPGPAPIVPPPPPPPDPTPTPGPGPGPPTPVPPVIPAVASPASGIKGIPSSIQPSSAGAATLGTAKNPPTASTRQTLVVVTKGKKPKTTVLAQGATKIARGATAKLTAKLTAAGRALLKSKASAKVTLLIDTVGPTGKKATTKKSVTLRRPKSKPRR